MTCSGAGLEQVARARESCGQQLATAELDDVPSRIMVGSSELLYQTQPMTLPKPVQPAGSTNIGFEANPERPWRCCDLGAAPKHH
jgi:hypothetical protein